MTVSVDALIHHLAQCPPIFLDDPVINGRGQVHTEAVVHDLLIDCGWQTDAPPDTSAFRQRAKKYHNPFRCVQVAAWLLSEPGLREHGFDLQRALAYLQKGMKKLAKLVDAELFVTDPDRREEFARRLLAALDIPPMDESASQAADRLASLDSIALHKVIAEAEKRRKEEERKRKLEEEMRQKQAQEAAAKANREW